MRPPAHYFPVQSGALKLVAGLRRHGVDCGAGERDREFFQVDTERDDYLRAKRQAPPERHQRAGEDGAAMRARSAALTWMRATLSREQPAALAEATGIAARDELEQLALTIQEDFAVLCEGAEGEGRVVALDVRFPSGWAPEQLSGASFARMHEPVPDFAKSREAAASMVQAMIERGPYVRFVWTLCADARLDHHPSVRGVVDWSQVRAPWLRVERQISVPLPEARASLFLIRTYRYRVEALSAPERATLRAALASVPDEVRVYKGLPAPALLNALL
jgi:hypothetical protein